MGRRVTWIRLAAAIASGLMIAALFPPHHLEALAWVAFAPLLAALWSVDGKRAAWKGFGLGFLAGAVSHGVQLSWISVVSPLGAIVLPLYLGLFWGAFGAFAATLGNPGKTTRSLAAQVGCTFANAAVWAALEWLRGWLFTGFGWNGLGVAFHQNELFAQAADLLGVAGLSLFLVLIQGLLVLAIKQRQGKSLIPALSLVALVAGYGAFRLHSEKARATTPLKALLVQINIPQDAAEVQWDALTVHTAYENDTLAALAAAKANNEFPDWVVWPESALTGRILRTDDGAWGAWQENVDTIAAIREGGDFSLIYGANELEAVNDGDALVRKPNGKAYNSLVVMSPENELQSFRKHHLVIFGETIPFVDTIPFLKKIYEQQAGVEYGGSFTAGDSFEPLPVKAGDTMIGVIPTVCFEDTVSRLTRKFVKPGPQIIMNVTNDGWFKESPAADQHFANARFRAIELRRPMIRCANTGVTAAITSTGSTVDPETGKSQILIDSKGSHFTRGSLLTKLQIPLNPATTLYSLIGDWGIIVAGIFGFARSIVHHKRRRQIEIR
jgi:apolipoprotein N-acyltransferase